MNVGRRVLASVAALSAAIGVLAGVWFSPESESVATGGAADEHASAAGHGEQRVAELRTGPSRAEYEELKRDFEHERALRSALEEELAHLLASPPETEADSRALHVAPSQHAMVQTEPLATETLAAPVDEPEQPQEWFNRTALEQAGLSSSEIREIEDRWEEYEMQKLYLTDRATREGTLNTREYMAEVAQLDRAVREDLGNEGYDAYLYATTKFNRIMLNQVLENSPAGYSGLQANDIVIRYAGNRVFHPYELKIATNRGNPGLATSVEVLRDGQRLEFSIPRGPLGVQLKPMLSPPDRNL